MIAIVHRTIFGDKLDTTLAALLAGEYRLRPTNATDAATSARITTTLQPRTLLRSDFGLELPLVDLMDHMADADEASAVRHAIECLQAPRSSERIQDRIELGLDAIMQASIGSVPDRSTSVVDVSTGNPWKPFTITWWNLSDGPRDGSVPFRPSVQIDEMMPACVIVDHYVDANAHGHLGIASVRRSMSADADMPDAVETLRVLKDMIDMPIATIAPRFQHVDAIDPEQDASA